MKRNGGNDATTPRIVLLVFRLGEQRYALPAETVERIVRAVQVTPLPGAPDVVLGAIDVQGTVLPVLSMRRRFGLAQPAIGPNDQFVLARTADRPVALVIDAALGVIGYPAGAITAAIQVLPGAGQFRGVVKCEDGLVLIYDLEHFLSLDEAGALDEAILREAADAS